MNLKVGDRVKIRTDLICNRNYGKVRTMYGMSQFAGKIVTIKKIYMDNSFQIQESDSEWFWSEEMIESFTKANLENGMVVEYYNGVRKLVLGNKFLDKNSCTSINCFNDTLEHKDNNNFTIDKVYKSNACNLNSYFHDDNLELIWERLAKKMTIAEIEKELGYKIEIIEEDE